MFKASMFPLDIFPSPLLTTEKAFEEVERSVFRASHYVQPGNGLVLLAF